MSEKVSTITKEQLLANGWELTGDLIYPCKKCLVDKEAEDFDPELGYLELVLHGLYNERVFALSVPDGGLLNINPATIEELNAFEKMILSYDPY